MEPRPCTRLQCSHHLPLPGSKAPGAGGSQVQRRLPPIGVHPSLLAQQEHERTWMGQEGRRAPNKERAVAAGRLGEEGRLAVPELPG